MNTLPTVSDTKRAFYSRHTRPVNSVYRRVVEELLVEMHLLRVNADFRYDAIYALGIVTSFNRFMEGYEPAADVDSIFEALVRAEALEPETIKSNAKHLLETVRPQSLSQLMDWFTSAATSGGGEFESQIKAIADSPSFKYSRLFGIGLYTLLETVAPEAIKSEETLKENLTTLGTILPLSLDKLTKDIEFYRANLEKVQQARQTLADIVEADRKRNAQRLAEQQSPREVEASSAPSETGEESSSAPSN
ncbi:photosystem II biogenesis protein Psp29 [Lyngbya confervoides]|uniref:Protein Thf1 n=1 Tax=Lyngbya confervoides BDU141951 TaxID=1574623 RepID=A0ABD4T5N3_9CYAN|nr:photosystem II biogenesis protein Psp29 [Lyngbya confervoides]MCM1983842.1 photosystem II biogenesis protein Psp29 [Lyngbya confervoides BDU141951]